MLRITITILILAFSGPADSGAQVSCCDTPGDANGNGSTNVADAIFIINLVFNNGPTPVCSDQADANGNSSVNVADAIYIVNLVFNNGPAAVCPVVDTANYVVTFDAVWSAVTHPNSFPPNPHFSGLVGATHDSNVTFWEPGGLATEGIKQMAELGSKTAVLSEINVAILASDAQFVLSGGGINPSPGSRSLGFTITSSYSLVTLVSMIAPSPDWFVGVSGLPLSENGLWLDTVIVVLYPYDAGTDDGISYTSGNASSNPRVAVFQILGAPFAVSDSVPALGTFTFIRQ